MNKPDFSILPAELMGQVVLQWEDFLQRCNLQDLGDFLNTETRASMPKVWCSSHYVAKFCCREPALFKALCSSAGLTHERASNYYLETLQAQVAQVQTRDELHHELRQFRKVEMVRLMWRDISNWTGYETLTRELSALADACISVAYHWLYANLVTQYGYPLNSEGQQLPLTIIALGKLGGNELNLSSDVDLLFGFPEDGNTDHPTKALENREFFTKLAQQLIQSLSLVTVDGFVFRVDMRLRPHGQAGPLVMSHEGLGKYYLRQRQSWERYALIRARLICGGSEFAKPLLKTIQRLVYRYYTYYAALETLRFVKKRIEQEALGGRFARDIKRGAGGIRELEFSVQSFQLIHGGRRPFLRKRRLLTVLEELGKNGYLNNATIHELRNIYVFLRTVEHRLQAVADQQTHELPQAELEQIRLAFSLDYESWESLQAELAEKMHLVHEHFLNIVSSPEVEQSYQRLDLRETDLRKLWITLPSLETLRAIFEKTGYEECQTLAELFISLREAKAFEKWTPEQKRCIEQLIPPIVLAIIAGAHPAQTLQHLFVVLHASLVNEDYLLLLIENPQALVQLVKLSATSPLICHQLASYPTLFDELCNSETLYTPLDETALAHELDHYLAEVPSDDLQEKMNVLRLFKQSQILRVAAADVRGVSPLMKVSDHLTFTATVILRRIQELAWYEMSQRYGYPSDEGVMLRSSSFMIIGYGKLGGIEMSYSSDLDLVFVHAGDSRFAQQNTEGTNPISNGEFYLRVAKRMIQYMNQTTELGVLYKVDMRLRPSGDSGPLVCSSDAFEKYQEHDAWIWEHQALVRARVVSGSPEMAAHFIRVRRQTLARVRDENDLREEVLGMRKKMVVSSSSDAESFDLKSSPGGITDIEFIVQFGILAWSHAHPELLTHPDNIRILDGFGERGLLLEQDVESLSDAYRTYRAAAHRLILTNKPQCVAVDVFVEYREAVLAIWNRLIADPVCQEGG